jgi:small subunit ribosomal protein S14
MAKKSKIAKNNQRAEIIERYRERRTELLSVIKDPAATIEAKREAYKAIAKMPRDASPTRYRNRCGVSGRPRAFLRQFGMSRIAVRELAHRGELPGVKKSSW